MGQLLIRQAPVNEVLNQVNVECGSRRLEFTPYHLWSEEESEIPFFSSTFVSLSHSHRRHVKWMTTEQDTLQIE